MFHCYGDNGINKFLYIIVLNNNLLLNNSLLSIYHLQLGQNVNDNRGA